MDDMSDSDSEAALQRQLEESQEAQEAEFQRQLEESQEAQEAEFQRQLEESEEAQEAELERQIEAEFQRHLEESEEAQEAEFQRQHEESEEAQEMEKREAELERQLEVLEEVQVAQFEIWQEAFIEGQVAQFEIWQEAFIEAQEAKYKRLQGTSQLPRYEMRKDRRGLCVIINNTYTNDASKRRDGSEFDEKKLIDLFKNLSFIVKVTNNLRADQMLTAAKQYGNEDHSNYDAFVFIVMSHGGDGDAIEGVKGVTISIEKLMSEFKATKCPSLQNKPKLFFIQTCRGQLYESLSRPIVTADFADPISSDSTLKGSVCPQEADFLLAFATAPGYVAWRNPSSGSLFIQTLVDTIEELHLNHHLLDILTEVTRRVVEKGKSKGKRNGNGIQVPAPTHTLRFQLYL